MTQSDTQQSELTPADTPPEQKPATSEELASAPNVPNASTAEVDALLDQVQNLTQDIIEDAVSDTDTTDSGADEPPDVGNAATASNAATVVDGVAESPVNTDVDKAPQEAASALPPILELESDAEAPDVPESEADYEEAHAILESLQSSGPGQDDALEVDPEGQLVAPADSVGVELSTADTEGGQQLETPTQADLNENEADEAADVASAPSDDDADLPNLLQDPDSAEAIDSQLSPGSEGTVESAEAEASEESSSASEQLAASTVLQREATRTKKPRWQRVTKIVMRRAAYRARHAITNPVQLFRGIMAGPKRLFALFDHVLIWLDRPFAEMSPHRKHVIGIVALATLIAGTLIWVLPLIAYSNPFSDMSRGISSVPQ